MKSSADQHQQLKEKSSTQTVDLQCNARERLALKIFRQDQVNFLKQNFLLSIHLLENQQFISTFRQIHSIIVSNQSFDQSTTKDLELSVAKEALRLLKKCVFEQNLELQQQQLSRVAEFFRQRCRVIYESKLSSQMQSQDKLLQLSTQRRQQAIQLQKKVLPVIPSWNQEKMSKLSQDGSQYFDVQPQQKVSMMDRKLSGSQKLSAISKKQVSFQTSQELADDVHEMQDFFSSKRVKSKTMMNQPRFRSLSNMNLKVTTNLSPLKTINQQQSAIPKPGDLSSSGVRHRKYSDVSSKISNYGSEQKVVPRKFKDHYFITDSEKILKRESCLHYCSVLLNHQRTIQFNNQQQRLQIKLKQVHKPADYSEDEDEKSIIVPDEIQKQFISSSMQFYDTDYRGEPDTMLTEIQDESYSSDKKANIFSKKLSIEQTTQETTQASPHGFQSENVYGMISGTVFNQRARNSLLNKSGDVKDQMKLKNSVTVKLKKRGLTETRSEFVLPKIDRNEDQSNCYEQESIKKYLASQSIFIEQKAMERCFQNEHPLFLQLE